MENKFESTEDVWFIVKSGESIHHGKIKAGETLSTINQIDTYDVEESWKDALSKLGLDVKSNLK